MGAFLDTYFKLKVIDNKDLQEAYKLLQESMGDFEELIKDNTSDGFWNKYVEYDIRVTQASCKLECYLLNPTLMVMSKAISFSIKIYASEQTFRYEYDITSSLSGTRLVDTIESSSLKLEEKYVRVILEETFKLWDLKQKNKS